MRKNLLVIISLGIILLSACGSGINDTESLENSKDSTEQEGVEITDSQGSTEEKVKFVSNDYNILSSIHLTNESLAESVLLVEVEKNDSLFTLENLYNLLGIIAIFIGAYYTVVDSIASSILFLRPNPDNLLRLNYDLSRLEDKRKYNKDIIYILLIVLASAIYSKNTINGLIGILIAILIVAVFAFYVSYCEFKRKKTILTIQIFDKVEDEISLENYEYWYFLFRTEEGYVFSKNKFQKYAKDNLEELIYLSEEEVLKYYVGYEYYGPDNFLKYLKNSFKN